MITNEQHQLLSRAVIGELTTDEALRLKNHCLENPELLNEIARHLTVERLLTPALRDVEGKTFVRELEERLKHEKVASLDDRLPLLVASKLKREKHWRQAWRIAAVLAILVAGASFWFVSREGTGAASVVRAEAMTGDDARSISMGSRYQDGARLSFTAGLAELKFACGSTVILEGPADFEITDRWHCRLFQGRVVARVPEQAHGFTMDGPRGRLVDLGTEFGMKVDSAGDMEVHVLEGLVETTPQGETKARRLKQSQGLRLSASAPQDLVADPAAFITAMPPVSNRHSGFVHWSLNESAVPFKNTGRGLSEGHANLIPRRKSEVDSLPQAVSGRFGKGLAFDGIGSFAESDFHGIGGNAPRTVAFWVKVPQDFMPSQGYAILSWGSSIEDGAAWQISINPTEKEGPLGRLRVGVFNGPVVGTKDLRDGQWHHCAVVMYGGPNADVSTHVLLYVDGRLEPAARKAVMEIQTDTTSPKSHGIWMGRNLGVPKTPAGSFFRGTLDEVYIFDSALGQNEILRLMKENKV